MIKKIAVIVVLVSIITIPLFRFDVLPTIGDPNSAPNTHVSDYYIENAVKDTDAPNLVTAVIVDYRAFDTLLETTVMFLAGMSVAVILSFRTKPRGKAQGLLVKKGTLRDGQALFHSRTKEVVISVMIPFIVLYAFYVLLHGELSIGGGFQAGALIGMAYLLDRIALPEKDLFPRLSKNAAVSIAGAGTFIYALTGILTLIGGGAFLAYEYLPNFFGKTPGELHVLGITLVEVGVTFGVAFTIVTIITSMAERVSFDDD